VGCGKLRERVRVWYKPLGLSDAARAFARRFVILMPSAYIPIAIFVVVATGFAVFTLVFTSLIHPSKYNKVKLEPYECGIEPQTDARDRYSIRYYLVAMLFVIFDVETVFMFPWAVIFNKLALFGLIEMIVFIFILVVGYYYAWQKGALEWA
jgi:NADH-quinone oxidoreductase subunit A